jgi:PAS domain S-box-containing protein
MTDRAAAVLRCDMEGITTRVERDDLGLGPAVAPGRPLSLAVARPDMGQALGLIADMQTREVATARLALSTRVDGIVSLYVVGVARDGGLWVALARSPEAMARVCAAAGLPPAQIEALSMALAARSTEHAQPGSAFYDELTRLNSELANLQRELARHADELERSVAQRSAALRASEERFRTLFEQAPMGIALVAIDGSLLAVNPALHEMLGCEANDCSTSFAALLGDGSVHGRPDYRALLDKRRGSFRQERRIVRNDGREAWLRLTISLVRQDGDTRFAIYMVDDITAQEQAQEALLQAERLAVVGRLAASLTHEINNPLQSVIGFLGLAEETLAEGGDVSRYIGVALPELRRVARIVGGLRGLGRPSSREERRPTDVNILMERVLDLTGRRSRDQGVEVIWCPAPDLLPLSAVSDRIEQVFLNLVLNALDAMPQGGQLAVITEITHAPDGVRITLSDSGAGIPPDVQARLFEPFVSTKEDGMGLGLFISHDIVRQHDGRITIESMPGQGSQFTIWLPARRDSTAQTRGEQR